MKKDFCKISTKGFTLIELLVVVLIIGILAAIALPQYQQAVRRATLARYMPIVDALYKAQQIYYLEEGRFATNLDNLDIGLSLPTAGCQRTSNSTNDQYACGEELFGLTNFMHSIEGGNEQIKYVKFFENNTWNGVSFEKDKAYCFAGDEISKKVCQSAGGTHIGSVYWDYYEL